MCFNDNLGENLSIDETALSNGELYTTVTGKTGHGKHDTVIETFKNHNDRILNFFKTDSPMLQLNLSMPNLNLSELHSEE